jgi:LPS-assembly lipoprotein
MSWFRIAYVSVILSATIATSGCVRPLLAGAGGDHLVEEMSSIRLEPIPERLGHYLVNELAFALKGSRETSEKYRLIISLSQRIQTPIVDTVSGRATSTTVLVDAEYRLRLIGSEKDVASGVAFTMISYDRTSQRYSNIRAGKDAEVKAARALSEQIRMKLISDLIARR